MKHEDLDGLMQERPDGIKPSVDLSEIADGFSIVATGNDESDAGMTAHRGVLADGEFVDPEELQAAIEAELGYTYAEITAVYKAGPKSATQREFRTYVDARMLALSLSGANMTAVAASLDLSRAAVNRALDRARELYIEPRPYTPVVMKVRSCFTCESMKAVPRKHRHNKEFIDAKFRGERATIDLCAVCYSAGFETRPGNAAYWASRSQGKPVTAEDAERSIVRMRELLRTGV